MDYDLDTEQIISWAKNYAAYDELEKTAKALYFLFKERQEKEKPKDYYKTSPNKRKRVRRRK